MADEIETDFDANAISEAIYGDAFSEGTEKSGRNLLLGSGLINRDRRLL